MRGNTELLLSGGYDAHVGVWDVAKRKTTMPRIEAMLRAHTQEILCLKANSVSDAPPPAAASHRQPPPPRCDAMRRAMRCDPPP